MERLFPAVLMTLLLAGCAMFGGRERTDAAAEADQVLATASHTAADERLAAELKGEVEIDAGQGRGGFAVTERGTGFLDAPGEEPGLGPAFWFYLAIGIILFIALVWLFWVRYRPARYRDPDEEHYVRVK